MDQFLEKVQTGMEKHGYTQGNWTKINQNVDNDFAVAYAAILSIRERLQTVKTFDKSSTEYQVAMDDLRGTLRELDIGQQEAVAWEYLWIWFALILSIIFVVVGAIIYETNRDYI
ncbi:MAG TPA: hypothetical protein VLE47_03875 [Candidatus Saccharimonadales bacterium]|nr:hypothetical protein [Candidatus Saccharimonadales bacterium]